MSIAESLTAPPQPSRRFHPRRKLDALAYVEFGQDNGAILIDLGEGGLGFQSVMPVSINEALLFKFKLPGENRYLEGSAEVVWMNESGKGGGLRFVNLNSDAQAYLREWSGAPPASEADAIKKTRGEGSEAPRERAAESAAAPKHESATPYSANGSVPTVAEDRAAGDKTQPPSPSANPGPYAKAVDAAQTAAERRTTPERAPVPEFTIEPMPALDAVPSAVAPQAWPESAPRAAATSAQPARPVPPKPANPITAPARALPYAPPAPKLEPAAAPADRPAETAPGSAVRQPWQAPARTPAWQLTTEVGAGNSSARQVTFASQGIKIAAGAAAGACVVLALVFGVPSLRTRVEATAAAKIASATLANAPGFEVEVADLNNRRWILRGGGDAGSPFADPPSRRESSAASSRETAKPSRPEEPEEASSAIETKQSRAPKPGELVLSRPRANRPALAAAQVTAPSIFDGITPPIGAVSDGLARGGPEAPGIVQPVQQPKARTSVLESAVLLQRVPPVYPPLAVSSRTQGDVTINATVGKDGVPRNLSVARGDVRLVSAALAAIRQWRYRPATLGGQPIETQIAITLSFELK